MKSYKNYILENISLSNNTIIEILKELKNSNNMTLINNIISNVDKQGRSLLMNAVKKNKQDLIEFILEFKPDMNYLDKNGLNVLYYAKNLKTVNLLIDNGAEFISTEKNPLLVHFANKKIFNINLYKKILDMNIVKLTDMDKYNQTVFSLLITNNKAISFLASYHIKITDDNALENIYSSIINNYKYSAKKGKLNGLIILIKEKIVEINCLFFKKIKNELFSTYTSNNLEYFITQLKDIISYKDFIFIDTYDNSNISGTLKYLHELLDDIYDEDVIEFVESLRNTNHNKIYYNACSYDDYLRKIKMEKAKKFNL
jgi:hypothetical protein